MKSMAIFLTLTIAAAVATVACGGGDKPATDPTSATAASGETSSETPATAGSDTAAPASSGM